MKDSDLHISQENVWYPRHVSDLADQLIDELAEEQLGQLYGALITMSEASWMMWLEGSREEVSKYDALGPSERRLKLQKNGSVEALRLHHACVFIELWRSRLNNKYLPLPPHGKPIDDPESQREMMLAVVTSYYDYDERDLWPFEFPEGESSIPFRKE